MSEVERRAPHLEEMETCPNLKLLAQKCLEDDPSNRPLITEVIEDLKRSYCHHNDESVIEMFASARTLAEQVTEKDKLLKIKDEQLIQKDKEISQITIQKNHQLQQQDQEIGLIIHQTDQQLRENKQEIAAKDFMILQKDTEIIDARNCP